MPLTKSKTKQAFVGNLKAELAAGKPRDQSLAIAFAVKRRARAEGGGVHIGPISSTVPGRTDDHPIDVAAGSYVIPAECVSNLGENNTNAGMVKLDEVMNSTPEQIRKFFDAKPPSRSDGGRSGNDDPSEAVPINAAGGEFVVPPKIIAIVGHGDVKRGHATLDAWVMKRRQNHIKTLRGLAPPARD